MGEWLPTIGEARDAWLADLRLGGHPETTCQTYRSMTRPLEGAARPVVGLTADVCRAALTERIERGQRLTSVATCHGAFASLTRYCVDRGWFQIDPMARIPCPKPKPQPHRFLDRDELRLIWRMCRDDDERLIVALLMEGLRASELVGIRQRDIRADVLTVYGKRDTVRSIALPPKVVTLLAMRGDPVFPFGRSALGLRIKKLGQRCGLRLHPHMFRHAFASHWMLEVGDSLTLQLLGGWANDRMIRQVYARSAVEAVAMRKARAVDLSSRLLEAPHEATDEAGGD